MNLASITATLKKKGYTPVTHNVIENGTTKQGISILETYTSPCICVEELIQNNPSIKNEELVAQIINIHESQKAISTSSIPMYVVTNKNPLPEGQYAIPSSVKAWALDEGVSRLLLLPTDRPEILLLPVADEELDTECLCETTNTQLQPEEKLDHSAYLLHLEVA